MGQLHFYVPRNIDLNLRKKAKDKGLSISKYLAELVTSDLKGWPEGYFESVVGGWVGEPLQRGPQGELEERKEF